MARPYFKLNDEEKRLLAEIVTKLEPFQAETAKQVANIVAECEELDERLYPKAQLHQLLPSLIARFWADVQASDPEAYMSSRVQRFRELAEQGVAFNSAIIAPAVLQEVTASALVQAYADNKQLARAAATLAKCFCWIFSQQAEWYLTAKEEVIKAQQQAVLQLSTPVIQVWEGILVAPLVGAIDSERAMQITQNLLNMVRDTKASIAIIDISGVPMVDTQVANHLLKTVRATRLLGAKCLIVGISPEIAETLINLGVDMSGIDTYSSLHTGLQHAFRELGQTVGANHVG